MGITAGADVIGPLGAVAVGAISGALVVGAVLAIDAIHLDDPVGAIAVHLVCGIWGTLAVGLFADDVAMWPQVAGVAATGLFCFATSWSLFVALKAAMGLRVGHAEERGGLDVGEHGMAAYGDWPSRRHRSAAADPVEPKTAPKWS